MKCEFTIDQEAYSYELEGDFFWGKDKVLFEEENSLIQYCDWRSQGYSILSFDYSEPVSVYDSQPEGTEKKAVEENLLTALYVAVTAAMRRIIGELGIELPADFVPEHYHRYISNDALHQQVIRQTRWLTRKDIDIDWDRIEGLISAFLRTPVGFENPLLAEEIIILRISRPRSLDINPLHRDGYLDLWQHVINLWIPIAGCNARSSLPLLPGSHLWSEKHILRTASQGAAINGLTYHVPGIAKANRPLDLIRPRLQSGQALLFTPFLIHGSALNLNEDTTRFSLELRLCDKRKQP